MAVDESTPRERLADVLTLVALVVGSLTFLALLRF